MRILISNDDGVHAPGIEALAAEFSRDHQVVVVAPERERSTTGHSLTLHKPLRLYRHAKNKFAVSGGPADCIYVALSEVLKGKRPDLVLSGINRGANLGQDVFYSGTASAAREAANLGIPSVAVSLALDFFSKPKRGERYEVAAKCLRKVIDQSLAAYAGDGLATKRATRAAVERAGLKKWPSGMMLNVNVPNLPLNKIKGIRAAKQGKRIYGSQVLKRSDGRGRDYFWLGGTLEGYAPIPESDCWYVDHGYVAVAPLELDTTFTAVYDQMKGIWGEKV
ncbi:MAG: 5'/3'-nucleotidase SurE [Proteobacteria bacterium]|nr:MAG: 5'/3'-nucleotidase SurE [Pseudomonadota bacterium]